MTVKLPLVVMTSLVGASILMTAYGQDEKVSAELCPKIASHIQDIQLHQAPSLSAVLASCKVASDEERGCMLAASSSQQLAKCLG